MAYKLIEIEGIGPAMAQRLEERAGLTTVEALLEAAASKKGRQQLAEQTGIDESRLLHWANMADLFRLKGVGEEFSHLLEKAGVDTIKELRNRSAANLHAKMVEVNAGNTVANRNPRLDEVESWVNQAKEMEPRVTH
jgi:predicted flap endonuclease-1-like 5' DNA nuclease